MTTNVIEFPTQDRRTDAWHCEVCGTIEVEMWIRDDGAVFCKWCAESDDDPRPAA